MLDRRLKALCMGVAIGLACSPAFAQSEYPTRALTTMVGTSPGGGSDTMGRMVSQKLSEILGKPVVVENRPGASNTIALAATAKAKPDGYTLFVGSSTPLSIAPHLIDLNYDGLKDIQPVALITLVPNILVINKDMGIKSVGELVDYMKKNPNKIKYGSSGLGTTHVMLAEMFNMAAGVKSVHVPYPGSPQIHIDLIAGVINIVTDSAPGLLPQIKAGNMTPLAVTSKQRIAEIPNVPTMAEAGYPAVEMDTMYGLYTTAGAPRPNVEKLNVAMNKALDDPDFKKKLIDFGGKVQKMTVAEFEDFHAKEFARCGEIIRKADIKAKAN
jgi:tripartite-type tricarboxylate transporter receptor subunit TctC